MRRGGDWKRGTVEIVGHSQTKGRDNGEPKLRPKPARQSSTLPLTGSMLPFILQRIGFDPASASAPFVATLVDVTGLVIYFTVASVILQGTLL